MSDSGHDLHSEFPADGGILHRLKVEDHRFRHLSDRYHQLNKDIHRIETGIDAADDERLEAMKKERVTLLDEVARLIAAARVAS